MKWKRGYQSDDVQVRRGGIGGGGGMGGGIFGLVLSMVTSKFGWIGGLVVVGAYLLFMNFGGGLTDSSNVATPGDQQFEQAAKDDPRVQFVSFVLDDIQTNWARIYEKQGSTYKRAQLVIFEGATSTGCGTGDTAVGPFYCPLDQNVYLDLGFFRTLDARLGAKGDFAQAYVIAHEVGHHVQNLTGVLKSGSSIAVELQADCYAGVWAASTKERDLLEQGDIEEAMTAAAAVGDDNLQRMSTGTVQPEKWTHGSSKERAGWFNRGFESGDPRACDTTRDATARRER